MINIHHIVDDMHCCTLSCSHSVKNIPPHIGIGLVCVSIATIVLVWYSTLVLSHKMMINWY